MSKDYIPRFEIITCPITGTIKRITLHMLKPSEVSLNPDLVGLEDIQHPYHHWIAKGLIGK